MMPVMNSVSEWGGMEGGAAVEGGGDRPRSLVVADGGQDGIHTAVNGRGATPASIVHRSYALNDVVALKKKLTHESNKEPFTNGKEAKDGSNFTVQMRASVFDKFSYIVSAIFCRRGYSESANAVSF